MTEQANFSELRNKISNWDLEAEEMLLNKLKIFTNSYNTDFANFTKNMQSLNNNLSNMQVQHYNAIINLKDLSMNRFIEETIDINSESASEESDIPEPKTNNDIYMNEGEKIKKAMEITLDNIDKINSKKDKNKEQIEDDATSVASSKLIFDNFKKYNLPFIIGTDDFNKESTIGLSNEQLDNEEESEEKDEGVDEDVKDFVEENVKVDDKVKEEWVNIERKKKEKKEKEKAKKEKKEKKNKNNQNEIDNKNDNNENNKNNFDNEVKEEIKVPIENEQGNNNIVVTSNSGATIPPPPPPPPMPVFNPSKIKPKEPNKPISNDVNLDKKMINNEKPKENIQMPNIQQEIIQMSNIQQQNIQKENINNNPITNTNNNIIKELPKKPIILQSVNPFLLKGLQNIPDDDDDDDDDDDLFSRNRRKVPKLNDKMNITQSQNPFVYMNDNKPNDNQKSNINKIKLDNIFEEEKETNENKKEEEEEEEKEIIPPPQKLEEKKDNNELIDETKKEENFENNNDKMPNINKNQNKVFNNLFDILFILY